MRIVRALISALALSVSAATAGAAELIVNGGFELGNFTPIGGGITTYDLITQAGPQDLTGWTVGNSLVWGVNTTDINPHAGSGFVDLTGVGDTIPHGILNQTVSTIIGQQYTFSIFETQDFAPVNVGINVLVNGVALALLGTPGLWVDNSGLTAVYGQLTGVFTAMTASTVIRIGSIEFAQGYHPFMIGLDDVSVTGPVPNVPIPAALPFLATGIAGLGFIARRRSKQMTGRRTSN